MSFVKSDNIQVFPTSLRGYNESDTNYSKGKYTSEENLTGIIKTLSNKPSFIINWDKPSNTGELVINGYYFNITNTAGDNGLPTGGELFAYIYLDSSHRLENENGFNADLDNNGVFSGLTFDTSLPSSGIEENNSLQILDSNGEVVQGNLYKFDAKTVYAIIDNSQGEEVSLYNIINNLYSSGIISTTGEVGIVPVNHGGTGVSSLGSWEVPVGTGNNAVQTIKAQSTNGGGTIVKRDSNNKFDGIVSNAERLDKNIGEPVEMGSDSIGYIPIVHFGTFNSKIGTPLVKNNIYYSYGEEFPEGLTPEDGDIFITLFNGD